MQKNNLALFKEHLESAEGDISEYVNAIQYGYDVSVNAYVKDPNGKFVKSDIMGLFNDMAGEDTLSSSYFSMVSSMSSSMSMLKVWEELIPEKSGKGINEMVKNQYDLGRRARGRPPRKRLWSFWTRTTSFLTLCSTRLSDRRRGAVRRVLCRSVR